MRTSILFIAIFFLAKTLTAQTVLTTVKIGNQEWASTNLDVTKFRNGDDIIQVKTIAEWKQAMKDKKPACCYSDFNPANSKLGMVYNYYAYHDERKIAPFGYHISKEEEWKTLVNILNTQGKYDVGQKMKSTSGWNTDPEYEKLYPNGTNSSGFNAIATGYLLYGSFTSKGISSVWWTEEKFSSSYSYVGRNSVFCLALDYTYYQINSWPTDGGYYIRCVKEENKFTEADKAFPYKVIADNYWMTENLNVSNYRNGDLIPYAKSKKELEEYKKKGIGACCSIDFKDKNDKIYGKLYNWYAVNDARGLAPKGWHVPAIKEWTELYEKTKQEKPEAWKSIDLWKNINGNNSTGFNGKPSGLCNDLIASGKGEQANWWSSTEEDGYNGYAVILFDTKFQATGFSAFKSQAYSVRCIKDL